MGCSPWGRKESDTTEQLSCTHSILMFMKFIICTFHFHALEKAMATHSSILAWRIPRTKEPGRLQSMGSQSVRHDGATFTFFSGFPGDSDGKQSACNAGDLVSIPGLGRSPGEGNGYPLHILASRIPWTEEPGGLQSMGSQRIGHN